MKLPLSCPSAISFRIVLIFGIWNLCFSTAASQSCYYPNGDLSKEQDVPCPSSSACCPLDWQCLSNGLCYLENQGYLGRYTCTDQSWGSACPQICTHDNTASGNEAVLECSSGNYCCDGNRPTVGCCETGGALFSLPDAPGLPSISAGSSATVVTSSATSQALAPSTSQRPTSSSSDTFLSSEVAASTSSVASSTAAVSTSSPTSAGTSLVTVTKVATDSAGSGPATVTSISTVDPTATLSSVTIQPSRPSTSKADIIAPAVAVPVVLIIIASTAFLLWRSRRNKKRRIAEDPNQLAYDEKSPPSTQGPGSDAYGYNTVGAGEVEHGSGYRGVPPAAGGNTQHYSHLSSELDGGAISPSHSELPGSSPVSQQHWEVGNGENNPHRYRPMSYELPGDSNGR